MDQARDTRPPKLSDSSGYSNHPAFLELVGMAFPSEISDSVGMEADFAQMNSHAQNIM